MFAEVRTADFLETVTLVVNTSAYDAGDLLSDRIEIADVVRKTNESLILQTITVIDKADQKAAFNLVFLDGDISLGTINGAPNISDANVLSYVIGHAPVAAADYLDLGGVSVATVRNVGLFLQTAIGSKTLYVAAVTTGTPTYGAAGDLVLKLGFLYTEAY